MNKFQYYKTLHLVTLFIRTAVISFSTDSSLRERSSSFIGRKCCKMTKKKEEIISKTLSGGFPITFHWVCLQFEDKNTSKSLNTRKQKNFLRNFDKDELTVEIFYGHPWNEWYKTSVIAHAGKIIHDFIDQITLN